MIRAHTDAQPVFDTIVRARSGSATPIRRVDLASRAAPLYFAAASINPDHEIVDASPEVPATAARDGLPVAPSSMARVNSPGHREDTNRAVRARLRGPAAPARALAVPMLARGSRHRRHLALAPRHHAFHGARSQLLQTFADQAVIAIENVRLFKELEARNRELTVALDRQTATADILRIIAQSPSQLQPVLDAIAASAVRLLRARSGTLSRVVGDQIELAAHTSTDDAGDAATRAAFPQPLSFGGVHAQTIRNRAPLNIADAHTDPRLPEAAHTYAQVRGYRSQGAVPMLRHDEVVGAIAVARRERRGIHGRRRSPCSRPSPTKRSSRSRTCVCSRSWSTINRDLTRRWITDRDK